jgi:hypothetical protein
MFARIVAALAVTGSMYSAIGCAVDAHAPGVNGDFAQMPRIGEAEGPCTDGATRACSVELSRTEEVVNCFSGVSVCTGGVWGACGSPDDGSGATMTSKSLVGLTDSAPGDLSAKAIGESSPTTGICKSNPCDPYCRNYDERPAIAYSTGAVTSSWYENATGFGGSPPGFISKLVREPCNSPIDCGYDLHCDYSTKKCVRNEPGWTYAPSVCGTTDITVGAACEVAGRVTFPVCNRGNVAVPAGKEIRLALQNGNWIRQPECPVAPVNCKQALTAPLYPGACVQVDACGYSGNVVAFVNIDGSISECPGTGGSLGCSDNWSDVKVVECAYQSITSYEPKTFVQQYKAVCALGSRPSWQLLAYDATTAANQSGASAVKFEVQTAPLLSNGAPGTFSPYVTAANTAAGDPANCAVSGPTPCPKNLFTALGGKPSSYDQVLNLKISLTPTPDQLAGATLRSWQVSYACVPTE